MSESLASDPHSEDFEDLFDNAPCGYLSLQPDGRISMVNQTITNWTGFGREALVGKHLREILQFSSKIFLETHVLPLVRMQHRVEEVALDFTTKSGVKLTTLANMTERLNASGEPLSTRLIVLRAVDRRKYERELVAARDEAQIAVAAEREVAEFREQFIAVLGHDLRNPIASLASGVHLLRKEAFSPRALRIFELMQGSVDRASKLIDNVLDFARGRLGSGLTLSRERNAPLRQVLEHVIEELRSIAPDRAIEVDLSIDRPIDCDPQRLGQLASNLLGNALTHGADDQPILVSCASSDEVLEFSVANGGKPISADALTDLFQPFFRGKVAPSQQGLGLGLYIASQIAEAHGGELKATSSASETRFTFTMPL